MGAQSERSRAQDIYRGRQRKQPRGPSKGSATKAGALILLTSFWMLSEIDDRMLLLRGKGCRLKAPGCPEHPTGASLRGALRELSLLSCGCSFVSPGSYDQKGDVLITAASDHGPAPRDMRNSKTTTGGRRLRS